MTNPTYTRRERQIIDAVYAQGSASAQEIRALMADAPTDSAVRALLRTLVDKGHLRIERDGKRYLYHPTIGREKASEGALSRVVNAFFERSPLQAAMALVRMSDAPSAREVAELEALIAQAKARQHSGDVR
ncbi:MAG: BlaI/MecI/CopY family transcriptional regulator [Myxococcota bacterium]